MNQKQINFLMTLIFACVLFNVKWTELETIHWVMAIIMILVMILCFFPYHVAHFLNNLFNLPHPGPNDPQGACLCRRHEGKEKYTFSQYVRGLFSKK